MDYVNIDNAIIGIGIIEKNQACLNFIVGEHPEGQYQINEIWRQWQYTLPLFIGLS